MDEQRHVTGRPDASAAEAEAIELAPRARPHETSSPAPAAEPATVRPQAPEPPETAEPDETEASDTEGSSGGIVGHLQNVAGPVAGAIGSVLEVANQAWSIREGIVERRLHRQAREPLANLYELYPEARLASPHELGLRFVPIEEIRGTAVAGAAQRGGDFLPLKPFRGENWDARWRRLREAHQRLQPLPPVDLIKYNGEYWVVDGHNRAALTLYANGVGLDAMVTELVPLDGRTSERPRNLLSYLGETAELRAAAQGHRPAMGMRQVEQMSADEAAHVSETGTSIGDEADAEGETEAESGADEEAGAAPRNESGPRARRPSSLEGAD
ncbi:MAG: hypothetical protein ABSB75_04630, partial [Candidatus Limnocylindrales bacterium]